MGDASLAVEIRTAGGKGVARKLRAAGRIPGVLYGTETPTTALTLDPDALEKVIRTSHVIAIRLAYNICR